MDDLGAPSSYLALAAGTKVYAKDGAELGEVEHVIADETTDIFDGIIIDRSVLPGGHRFAEADRIDSIHERGVVLALDRDEAERLPEPTEGPAALEVGAEDLAERDAGDELAEKLKRAWDVLSGKPR